MKHEKRNKKQKEDATRGFWKGINKEKEEFV